MFAKLPKSARSADACLVILFGALISLPVGRHLTKGQSTTLRSELRTPAPLPILLPKRDSLHGFPEKFDAYFNDQFGFREALIRALSMVKVRWLGVSSSAKVTVGKNGWLFSSEFPGGADFHAARLFTDDELTRWQRILESRRDWLAERDIRFLFVLAPNKQSIYPEHLPRALSRQQAFGSRVDQLLAHLRLHSDVQVLDLRDTMRIAKTGERLFDRTDTHWNDRGAFAAYQGIIKALSAEFPTRGPLGREAFEGTSNSRPGGDLARMLDLDDQMTEHTLHLVRTAPARSHPASTSAECGPGPVPFAMECEDAALPRAVVFCDSFAVRMTPFLSDHFTRVVYAWQMVFPTFEVDVVTRERPDVVIQEMVERKLVLPVPDVTPADPLCGSTETWASGLHRTIP